MDRLNEATGKAALISIQRGMPIAVSKKSVRIGDLYIDKNDKGFFDVLSSNKFPLYEDISVFDVAVIVAQRYSSGERSVIKKVLDLEEQFSKLHTDMIYYLHCIAGAKKKNDLERVSILEDKFQSAEMQAKILRDKISVFKRVK